MDQPIDLRVVGQLVSAIGVLDAFPPDESLGKFVVALLADIPGCGAASLCLRRQDGPIGNVRGSQCPDCVRQRHQIDDTVPYECGLAGQANLRIYRLETVAMLHGYLILNIGDASEYDQYEPFARNLGNALALAIDNRWQQAELRAARDLLEQRVNKRTAALSERERQLQEAQRVGGVGSWEWNALTDTISWSENYYRIYGFDPNQPPPGYEEHLRSYTPESAARLRLAVDHTMQSGEPYELDLERAPTGGPTMWVTARGEAVRDASSQIVGLRGTAHDITDRKRTEQALNEQYSTLRSIIDSTDAYIFSIDRQYRYTSFNAGHAEVMRQFFGAEIATSNSILDYHTVPEDREVARRNLDRALAGEHVVEEAYSGEESRSRRYFQVIHSPIKTETGEIIGVAVLAHDVTARKQAEDRIQRLSQLYATLSECNQAIVRCTSEDELFPRVCRATVDLGGMAMAWIGIVDEATKRVTPVASYGRDVAYLDGSEISVDAGSPSGRGPTGTAIRDNRPFWCQDFQADPATAPWRERAGRFAVRASATLPLLRNGVPIGALNLYSGTANAFDDEVRGLCVEMADDISFALDNFAREAARTRAEAALQKANAYTRSLIEASLDPLVTIGPDGRITDVNAATEMATGFARTELIGTDFAEYFTEPEAAREGYQQVFREGFVHDYPLELTHRDGRVMSVLYNASVYRDESGQVIGVFAAARDVTERKRAEEAMRESEERFRATFDQAAVGMAQLTPGGNWLRVNQKLCDIVGYTREELLQKSFQELTHPDDLQVDIENLPRLLSGEATSFSREKRYVRKDGAVVWVAVNSSLVRSVSGEPRYFIAITQDITSRKRAEQEKEQFLKFFLLSNDAMCMVDQSGCFTRVNPALVLMLGYSEGELLSKSALDFVLDEDRQRTADEMALQATVRASLDFQNHCIRKDGTMIFLSWDAYFDKNDGVTYATARDITERKRAEARIQRLSQLHATQSECNQAIVHCTSENELFPRVCRAAVDLGGMAMAWIGIVDEATKRVTPVASYGQGVEYLEGIEISVDAADPFGRGPTGTAIRANKPFWCQDFQHDPAMAPWRERVGRFAFRASAALPLLRNGVPIGALSVYSGTANAFDEEARELCLEIANDISFALDNFAREADRARAEEALRESELRLRTVVTNLPLVLAAVDRDGIFTLSEGKELESVGLQPGQMVGSSIWDMYADGGDNIAATRRVLAGETFQTIVQDGDMVFESYYVPILNRLGEVDGAIAVGLNITQRFHAEEALRKSEERFRATFEQAAVGIAHVAPDGRWLRVNQKLCDILGCTREELRQKSFQDVTHPDDVESDLEALQRLVAGEIPTYSREKRYLRKDGSVVWVELTGSLVRAASGEPDYFISVVEDISARKQAEAMEELESAALNAAADAMVITARDGAIEWVNLAFTTLTGYGAEEAIGKNPRALVRSGLHDQAFYRNLWDTILAGNVWQGELTNRRKDGSLYSEEQTITPVKDAAGKIAHFIAVKRDITERKRLEAQFLQSQKMEGVGQLAGGIAHDFNNLLNVINGTAFLAAQQLKAGDPLHDDLREITRAADRAAALTRQLLAFSRKQVLQPKVLDLGTLVLGLEGMLGRLIGEDIDLAVVPAKGSCIVRADPGQIEQVIMNLAVNARDAMPTGGTLSIETEAVQFDGAGGGASRPVKPGPYVMLTVSDSGTGMDEATLTRIFEPFFTTKEVGKGTGLGLSTVFGVVQQSGGTISVDSALGKGTTFRIWFPRVEEAVDTGRPALPVTSARGSETILVVEDYEGLRVLARRMLEKAGYTVLLASNGREALKLLESHAGPVHLLLTDVVMPGMNGPELAEQVTAAHPETRIIYASGYTDDDLLRHGVRAGADHFIPKPYTHEGLMRAVRTVLDLPLPAPQ